MRNYIKKKAQNLGSWYHIIGLVVQHAFIDFHSYDAGIFQLKETH